MRKNGIKITVAVGLTLLPIAVYLYTVDFLPDEIRIATGPVSGLYAEIMEDLMRELGPALKDEVEIIRVLTNGSSESFDKLELEEADIVLYQAGTRDFLAAREFDTADGDSNGELSRDEFESVQAVFKQYTFDVALCLTLQAA